MNYKNKHPVWRSKLTLDKFGKSEKHGCRIRPCFVIEKVVISFCTADTKQIEREIIEKESKTFPIEGTPDQNGDVLIYLIFTLFLHS